MKIILNILILISLSLPAFSQDFKSVYESLQENDRFSNMMNMQHYQAAKPDHAITYFILGGIYDEYMRETNPLNMFGFLKLNYRQVQIYYSLVSVKLDEKQARQDREYFGEVERITDKKRVGLPDILNETSNRLASATAYFENAQSVHDNYIRCITKYNSCLFKFREILHDYPNYKTLYLLIKPDLKSEIKEMALNFDSALVAFDSYRASCSKLPHLLKVNTYHLNPIITYRLEGLIEANFEDQLVELWDFKTWATRFLVLIDADITQIRVGLIETDNNLNDQIEELKNNELYGDELPYYQPEDKFQNLIGKYDHLSLCNKLINYKQSKIEYLLQTRLSANDIRDSSSFYLINKLRLFADLSKKLDLLNDEAATLKASISIDDIEKYIDFFGRQFNGMDGFARWCVVEQYYNKQIFDQNLEHLEVFIARDWHKFDYGDSVLVYKKKIIPFGNQYYSPDSLAGDTLVSEQVVQFNRQIYYIEGEEFTAKNRANGFLAQAGPSGKVNWMVSPRLKGSVKNVNTHISRLQVLSDSTCYAVAYTINQSGDSVHSGQAFIDKYDWNGKLKKQIARDSLSIPVYFWADEINEQYFVVQKKRNDSTDCCMMSFSLFNFNDSMLWRKDILLDGELVNVVRTNSDFFIICNYRKLIIPQTSIALHCDAMNQGVSGLYLSRQGALELVNDYQSNEGVSVHTGVKITNNTINLFGKYLDIENREPKLFYLLVDERGEPVFSNLEALKYQSYPIAN